MADQLVELLQFRREAMNQLLIVGPLLAGLAMGSAAIILSSAERGRLRAGLLIAFIASTLIFIFATALDAVILPGIGRAVALELSAQLPGFITLGRVVTVSMLAGSLILVGATGALGFLFSRRAGFCTLAAAGLTLLGFAWVAFYLDGVMRL